MLLERVGHANRRFGQRPLLAAGVARFDALDAALDLADVLEVVVEPRPVARSELALQLRGLARNPVEDAAVGLEVGLALVGGRADAEQLVEHDARVAHHRQRLLRRRPADRVGVDAGVAVGAAARLVDVLDRELHRRDRRVLAELLRVELVERGAGEDVVALGLLRVRLGQEHRARPEVIAADLRQRERLGVVHVGVADDGDVFAERRERLEGRAPLEIAPDLRRREQVLLDADARCCRRLPCTISMHTRRCFDAAAPAAVFANTVLRRHHRVEERQRDGDADAFQDGAPRNVLLRDVHGVLY